MSNLDEAIGAAFLVWLYRDGYAYGSKTNEPSELLVAPSNSSHCAVIYVALDVRLGVLRFLARPSFDAEGYVSSVNRTIDALSSTEIRSISIFREAERTVL